MDNEKQLKEISNRKLKVVIGLFLSLFSIILFINVTAVPRIFTFGFAYLFGFASYLIYIILYLIGMYMVFVNKPIKMKIPLLYIFAGIIVVIAAIILSTHIAVANCKYDGLIVDYQVRAKIVFDGKATNSVNFASIYNNIFFHADGDKTTNFNYLTADTINFFSNEFSLGCGLFGYLLLASGNTLFNNAAGGLILAIILFVIAMLMFGLPILIRVIKTHKRNKVSKPVEQDDEIDIEEDEEIRPNYQTNINREPQKVEPVKSEPYQANPNNEDSFFEEPNYGDNISNGMFVKPIFSIGEEDPDETPKPVANSDEAFTQPDVVDGAHVAEPSIAANISPAFFEEEEIQHAPIETNPVEPEVAPQREQMTLDFDVKPQIDESLVAAKPEFIDPDADRKPVSPQPQVNVQPQVQPQVEENKEARRPRVVWVAPSTDLLDPPESNEKAEKNIEVAENRQLAINGVFESFKIGARINGFVVGPSVTRFNVAYNANVSSKQVANIVNDIAIRLNGVPVRFVPIVEGQSYSGLEVPNAAIATVRFIDVFEKLPDVKKHPLAVAFGKNIQGDVIYADFDEFPHLLVAGTTGSGKSIFVNSIIATLIMRNSPDDLKIVLVDPKTVEMTRYKDMPHLLRPIIYTAKETLRMARKLQEEMERRYKLFSESNGATNIKEYNEDCEAAGKSEEKLPIIIFVLDEYADLVDQCKELSLPIVSLAQKARACGIHLFISTQRPSTNVVTGTIKANLPTHVALMCANTTDSVTIIGEGGAEELLGKGDMLVQSPLVSRVGCVRLQGCYASRNEITKVVQDLKARYETHYDPFFLNLEEEATDAANEMINSPEFQNVQADSEEEKYKMIKEWVMSQQFMSISRIQRECQVGFNRAGRFFIRLQEEGVVSDQVEGNKGCRVLVSNKFGDPGDNDDDNVVISDEQSYYRD